MNNQTQDGSTFHSVSQGSECGGYQGNLDDWSGRSVVVEMTTAGHTLSRGVEARSRRVTWVRSEAARSHEKRDHIGGVEATVTIIVTVGRWAGLSRWGNHNSRASATIASLAPVAAG